MVVQTVMTVLILAALVAVVVVAVKLPKPESGSTAASTESLAIDARELIFELPPQEVSQVHEAWPALSRAGLEPRFYTVFGDLIASKSSDDEVMVGAGLGAWYWVRTWDGAVELVGVDEESMFNTLESQSGTQMAFMPAVLNELLATAPELREFEVYGFKIPPLLGGEVKADNYEPTNLLTHLSIMGQIFEQASGRSGGEPVDEVEVVAPSNN